MASSSSVLLVLPTLSCKGFSLKDYVHFQRNFRNVVPSVSEGQHY